MAAFRFSLQKVLELRAERERDSARHLAEARRDADEVRKARESLETARAAGLSRLAQAHGSGTAVGHLQNLAYVVSSVEAQIRYAEDACRKADEQVDSKLHMYREAVKGRKTIEGLRERQLTQWKADEMLNERKVMDDIAMTRHARPESAGSKEDSR